MAPATRDSDLDTLKALTMLWVIVVHSMFWTGLAPKLPASYLLFEMPMFFFLSGASNQLGRKRSAVNFWGHRLKRILIPYWVYAGVVMAGTCAVSLALRVSPGITFWTWLVPMAVPKSIVPYTYWHLWFIPVYLLVMLMFPGLRWAYDRLSGRTRLLPLLCFGIGLMAVDLYARNPPETDLILYWSKSLLFYSFWVYLGLFYKSPAFESWSRRRFAVAALMAWLITFLLLRGAGYSTYMQENKLPPNTAFLMFGLGYLCAFAVATPWLMKLAAGRLFRAVLHPFIQYGYTVYLYHPIAFLGAAAVFRWGLRLNHIAVIPLYVVAVTLGSGLIARVMGPVEHGRLPYPMSPTEKSM